MLTLSSRSRRVGEPYQSRSFPVFILEGWETLSSELDDCDAELVAVWSSSPCPLTEISLRVQSQPFPVRAATEWSLVEGSLMKPPQYPRIASGIIYRGIALITKEARARQEVGPEVSTSSRRLSTASPPMRLDYSVRDSRPCLSGRRTHGSCVSKIHQPTVREAIPFWLRE